MAVTLINVFIVPAEKEEEFRRSWDQTSAKFSETPGFIETHLHRNTGVGNGTFQYINIARWESAQAWHDTHADLPPSEYTIAGVKGHPAIFECVVDLYRGGSPTAGSGNSPMYQSMFASPNA